MIVVSNRLPFVLKRDNDGILLRTARWVDIIIIPSSLVRGILGAVTVGDEWKLKISNINSLMQTSKKASCSGFVIFLGIKLYLLHSDNIKMITIGNNQIESRFLNFLQDAQEKKLRNSYILDEKSHFVVFFHEWNEWQNPH